MLCNSHDLAMTPCLEKTGAWYWTEVEYTSQYAHGVVIDVGANIGTHTLVYAKAADHVFSFEPQPFAYNNLCANLLLNNIINVTPIQCALGAYDGHTTIRVLDPTQINSTPGCRTGEGDSKVAIHKLGSMGFPPISFIKVDVEGSELDVLQGAAETLKRDKPVVYVEIHYLHLIPLITELMGRLGYNSRCLSITHMQSEAQFVEGDIVDTYGYLFNCT
jgi:FkbM family methyltransferase